VKASYTLTEAATVRFTVERRTKGRWQLLSGSQTKASKAGKTTVTFKRKLTAGTYRLVAVATDAAGNRSSAKRAGFSVTRHR
jgi:chitodextrinase